ncbi:MAG: phosphodiester glycosidase family protein [Bacteroidaceae bacterium]|nr:phosphodiester glycosidase family protein [Bacteroidaceae bacterium]
MKILLRIVVLLSAAAAAITSVEAQTTADSLTIVSAQWQEMQIAKGMKGRVAAFPSLYGGPQYVSIVEVKPRRRHRADIGVSRKMISTSQLARQHRALAAINGSYFNMKVGNSVCFLKLDGEVLDSTMRSEFTLRVTGAVRTRHGRLKIIPWDRATEQSYRKRHGSVLASGPLMLQGGKYADWSMCTQSFIDTKHPRSAIVVTKHHRVLLITVDGRAEGKAIGMSIPELAHLTKVLGGETALNLDGGGSTTLYLDGDILNHPCDNKQFDHAGERPIPNIIYFN